MLRICQPITASACNFPLHKKYSTSESGIHKFEIIISFTIFANILLEDLILPMVSFLLDKRILIGSKRQCSVDMSNTTSVLF